MNVPKDAARKPDQAGPPSDENEPTDRANELNELKENIKQAIDAEFQKFIDRACKFGVV